MSTDLKKIMVLANNCIMKNTMILGHHIKSSGSKNKLKNMLLKAVQLDTNALQIFLKSPLKFSESSIVKEDIVACQNIIEQNNLFLVVHGQYLLNFCNKAKRWEINSVVEDLVILESLIGKNQASNSGVVIHMGKNTKNLTVEECLENFKNALVCIVEASIDCKAKILLETSVRSKNDIFWSGIAMFNLIKSLPPKIGKRIGLVIDTCHIFASGFDISNVAGMQKYLDNFLDTFGKITCIHLNDSKNPLDSGLDRHEEIGKGFIFSNTEGKKALKYLLDYCKTNNIPLITETSPESVEKELLFLKSL